MTQKADLRSAMVAEGETARRPGDDREGTVSDPLVNIPPDGQRRELESCRSALESWTRQRVDTLAYPFGAPREDFTEDTVAIAASLGFNAGFTTRNDFARATEPALERSRFVVLAAVTAAELAHCIAYAWPR